MRASDFFFKWFERYVATGAAALVVWGFVLSVMKIASIVETGGGWRVSLWMLGWGVGSAICVWLFDVRKEKRDG